MNMRAEETRDPLLGLLPGLEATGDDLPAGAKIRVAIECGSTTVKAVVLDEEDRPVFGIYRPHGAHTYWESASLLELVLERFAEQQIVNVGFSGSSGKAIQETLHRFVDQALQEKYGVIGKTSQVNVKHTSEVTAQTVPVIQRYVKDGQGATIFEIGGEDAKYVKIASDGKILRTALNGECAAGTGTFIEEQVRRVGYPDLQSMLDGAWQEIQEEPPQLAARCTVFAKTAITFALRDEGRRPSEVAWGVMYAVASTYLKSVVGAIKKELAHEGPIVFQGGTAKNRVLVEAFRRLLEKYGVARERFLVPENPELKIAEGAAAYAARDLEDGEHIDRECLVEGLERLKEHIAQSQGKHVLPALDLPSSAQEEKDWRPHLFVPGERHTVFLGLDVGSTTTKLVLLDAATNAILYKKYLRTEGQPFEVMERSLKELHRTIQDGIHILHVGITGSGAQQVGEMIQADSIVDEINAHAKAVRFYYPHIDTMFEIGGQDSKFVRLNAQRVVGFEMNKLCAAGTGSFFDEVALEKLGVQVDALGDMGLTSEHPAPIGETCTVFMRSGIVQRQAENYNADDIAAGLAYAIANNYLNKVVGSRPVGDHVVFLGGVSKNPAVVAALHHKINEHLQPGAPKKEIFVPQHAEVMGAIGAALLSKLSYQEKAKANILPMTRFIGFQDGILPEDIKERGICKQPTCSNACRLFQMTRSDGSTFIFGDNMECELYNEVRDIEEIHTMDASEIERKVKTSLPDLLKERRKLLEADAPPAPIEEPSLSSPIPADQYTIGIPAGLTVYWESWPFWRTFFQTLGMKVVHSKKASKATLDKANQNLTIQSCLPVSMMFGMVADLLQNDEVTHIFVPSLFSLTGIDKTQKSSHTCPMIFAIPHVLQGAFEEHQRWQDKTFLAPELRLDAREEGHENIIAQLLSFVTEAFAQGKHSQGFIGKITGMQKQKAWDAWVRYAYACAQHAQDHFIAEQREIGRKTLEELDAADGNKKAAVFLARSYNGYDPGMNLRIDAIFRQLDVQVIPMHFLPLEQVQRPDHELDDERWYYQSMLLHAAQFVAQHPHLYGVYLSSFKCGPDAFIIKKAEEILREAGKELLQLSLDELSSTKGYQTRAAALINAFKLEEKERRVYTEEPKEERAQPQEAATLDSSDDSERHSKRASHNGPIALEVLQTKKRVFIPTVSEVSLLLAGALRAYGVAAESFEAIDNEAFELGLRCSNGQECIPFPATTGEIVHGLTKARREGTDPKELAVIWTVPGGCGQACRFEEYQGTHQDNIDQRGLQGATVVNLIFGPADTATGRYFLSPVDLSSWVWRAFLLRDYAYQLLLETRPYEIHMPESIDQKRALLHETLTLPPAARSFMAYNLKTHKKHVAALVALTRCEGEELAESIEALEEKDLQELKLSDLLYWKHMHHLSNTMGNKDALRRGVQAMLDDFATIPRNPALQLPLIGISGEIWVRMNEYGNLNLVHELEKLGAEAFLAPLSELVYDGTYWRGGWAERWTQWAFLRTIDAEMFGWFKSSYRRPTFGRGKDVIHARKHGQKYTGSFSAGEGPLSLGALEDWARHGADGGAIVGPFGCMPHQVYESLLESVTRHLPPELSHFPMTSVTISEARNVRNMVTRLQPFVDRARQFMKHKQRAKLQPPHDSAPQASFTE